MSETQDVIPELLALAKAQFTQVNVNPEPLFSCFVSPIETPDRIVARVQINEYLRARLADLEIAQGIDTSAVRSSLINDGTEAEWLQRLQRLIIPFMVRHGLVRLPN